MSTEPPKSRSRSMLISVCIHAAILIGIGVAIVLNRGGWPISLICFEGFVIAVHALIAGSITTRQGEDH